MLDKSVLACFSAGRSDRLIRELLDRPLFPDLTDAASTGFSVGDSPLARLEEPRGLSVLLLPGILERSERRDRDDSLVSDLLKEGYDCRGPSGPEPLPPSFEF
jgi:hypothetical protein